MGAPLAVHLRGITPATTSFLSRKPYHKGFSHLHTAGQDTVYVETHTKAHADSMAGQIQGMGCMSCYSPVSVHEETTSKSPSGFAALRLCARPTGNDRYSLIRD